MESGTNFSTLMDTQENFGQDQLDIFQEHRAFLLGLAYRILGSRSDAEDILQDIFIKWLQQPKSDILVPKAWLTTICTRQCIDLLRSTHKSRTEYIGTWLPEPYHSYEDSHEESDFTLSTAFLLLLEKLSPKERAAYLLHDIFDYDYSNIAEILDEKENYCRKLISRARLNIQLDKSPSSNPPTAHQIKLLNAFKDAVQSGDLNQLMQLLSSDVKLYADGGGKVSAISKPLLSLPKVSKLFEHLLFKAWNGLNWKMHFINGNFGFDFYDQEQNHIMVLSFEFKEHYIQDIYVQRNPDKLKEPV